MDFFLALLVAFVLSFVLGKFSKELGLPRATGYLIAGLLLGIPFLRDRLFDAPALDSFESLADFGVILLFFFAGLEISLKQFSRNLGESLSISLLNTALPMVAITGFMILMGFDFRVGLIMGLVLAVSAQALVLDILDEMGLLKDRLAQILINAGSVDDIVELVILTGVLAIVGLSSGHATGQLFIHLVLFVGAVVSAKLWILPAFFRLFSQTSAESIFGAALGIALFMGVLSNVLGFGTVIGALIAGILVRHFLSTEERKPWQEHRIANNIHLIGFGFFIPLFFVWVGFNTNLSTGLSDPFLVGALFALSFGLGILGTWLGVRLSKGNSLEGLLVALGMSTKGDVELAVGLIALKAGLITNELFSVIVIIALVSSIVPPILFKHFVREYAQGKPAPVERASARAIATASASLHSKHAVNAHTSTHLPKP